MSPLIDAERLKAQPNCRQPFALLPEEEVAPRQPSHLAENASASCPLLCALLRDKGSTLPRKPIASGEVAIIFGKRERTVRGWTAEGRLTAYHLGGLRYFAEDIEKFIRDSRLGRTKEEK